MRAGDDGSFVVSDAPLAGGRRRNAGPHPATEEDEMVFMFALRVLICVGIATPALAQSYPAKPVRLVVPFPSGSPSDILGRITGNALAERLGKPVVIDNRAGGAGLAGVEMVARAAPDGYTLVMGGTGALAISPGLRATMPYEVERDFAPISLVASAPFMLVTGHSVAANSVKELIALAKARPGQLNYASGGTGAVTHLAGEMFKAAARVDITHVAYRGTPAATTDLIAGQVQLMFSGITVLLPYVKSGKLKGLGVASTARSPLVPELPTLIESGLPGFTVNMWAGVLAPALTPAPVITRLNNEIVALIGASEVRSRLTALGATPVGDTPEAFRAFIRAEADKWRGVIRTAGVKED